MGTMKIIVFDLKIMEFHKKIRIPFENHKNHEDPRIPNENYENHKKS